MLYKSPVEIGRFFFFQLLEFERTNGPNRLLLHVINTLEMSTPQPVIQEQRSVWSDARRIMFFYICSLLGVLSVDQSYENCQSSIPVASPMGTSSSSGHAVKKD